MKIYNYTLINDASNHTVFSANIVDNVIETKIGWIVHTGIYTHKYFYNEPHVDWDGMRVTATLACCDEVENAKDILLDTIADYLTDKCVNDTVNMISRIKCVLAEKEK